MNENLRGGKFGPRCDVEMQIFPAPEVSDTDGFAAMGKPVPFWRRQAGYETCRAMGLTSENAYSAVGVMSEQLERDQPYDAMEKGMEYIDLTGTYRLMAVLLTASRPNTKES